MSTVIREAINFQVKAANLFEIGDFFEDEDNNLCVVINQGTSTDFFNFGTNAKGLINPNTEVRICNDVNISYTLLMAKV